MADGKLRKIGNSVGVLIPKTTLDALNLGEGDGVNFIRTANGVEMVPANDAVDRLMEIAERIMEEDHDVLRALAK